MTEIKGNYPACCACLHSLAQGRPYLSESLADGIFQRRRPYRRVVGPNETKLRLFDTRRKKTQFRVTRAGDTGARPQSIIGLSRADGVQEFGAKMGQTLRQTMPSNAKNAFMQVGRDGRYSQQIRVFRTRYGTCPSTIGV